MMNCRHCQAELKHNFIDLGYAPPSNAYITPEQNNQPEKWYPLKVKVCIECWLVQTEDHADRTEFFSDNYAYFSSYSASWLKHAKDYVKKVQTRFQLDKDSLVCEIAANDGYLLQYVQTAGIPCFGVEPTQSTAKAAIEKGIEIVDDFFSTFLAKELVANNRQSDLIVANNVLAHVPDINNFVQAFSILLKEQGVATFEFPHLLNLIEQMQFDTIYHEHYSYLSLTAVKTIFAKNGLNIFDVEDLSTHGGSLRLYAQRSDTGEKQVTEAVAKLLKKEKAANINRLTAYEGFQAKTEIIKNNLLEFLLVAKKEGKKVAAYGAAAKGNTFLNFAGIRPDLVSFVVDKNPNKAGQFMPGSHIPITDEESLKAQMPDYVLILPWNLKIEISQQITYIQEWGGQCVIAIPDLEILSW